jgi:hypothetical protein
LLLGISAITLAFAKFCFFAGYLNQSFTDLAYL